MSYKVRIVGGGQVGQSVADRLEYRGDDVVIIEADEYRSAALDSQGYDVQYGDGTDIDVLDSAGTDLADIFIAATGDDDTNLLATQLVQTKFDVETVLARVNNPTNEEPFEDLGIETISRSTATARLMDGYIESPALTRWTAGLGRVGDLQQIPVTNERLVGKTIQEIDRELPARCFIIVLGDEGSAQFPNDESIVEQGQDLTLMGERSAVQEASQLLDAEPDSVRTP